MLTRKFVKEVHGMEIMFKLNWMKEPCHAVVLADMKLGVSIKPYYVSDEEEAHMINDRAEYGGYSAEEVIVKMSDPSYCFYRARPKTPLANIRKIIAGTRGMSYDIGTSPVCPFA